MKKKIVLALMCFSLIASIAISYANNTGFTKKIDFKKELKPRILIDENNKDQKKINLSKDQILEIKLDEVMGTGYVWEIEIQDPEIANVIEDEFISIQEDIKEDENIAICGVGGTHKWAIKGVKEGSTKINLKLSRPWEEDGQKEELEYEIYVSNN